MQAVHIPCALTKSWNILVIFPQNGLLKHIKSIIFLYEGENAD